MGVIEERIEIDRLVEKSRTQHTQAQTLQYAWHMGLRAREKNNNQETE
jgi:hypothetical protein